jgi:uncharacterized protein YciI
MTSHQILFYDYVPDILDRRGPYRGEHLAGIAAAKADGRLLMAGPLGDPPIGAAIVFRGDLDRGVVEAFAQADPYLKAGLVTQHRIVPWNVLP